MPVYNLTEAWSDPIALTAGDILQNHDFGIIEITVGADPAVLRIPTSPGAIRAGAAASIRARTNGGTGALHVVRGLG